MPTYDANHVSLCFRYVNLWFKRLLTLRDDSTLAQSVQAARQEAERQQEAGVDTEALEAMARALLGNGQFEETEEDIPQMLEEFYPQMEEDGSTAVPTPPTVTTPRGTRTRASPLTSKLGKGIAPTPGAL